MCPPVGVYDFRVDLTLHRTLYRAALASSHIFAWIMLFDALRIFGSEFAALGLTIFLYVLAHTLSLFLTPLAGHALRNGIRRALSLAVLSYAFSILILAAAFTGFFGAAATNAWVGSVGFLVFYALHRALYYAPFSVEAGLVGYRIHPFTEISLAIIPVAAGLLISLPGGFFYALIVGTSLALASLVPLRSLPERPERFEWSYGEAFAALLVRNHRRLVWGAVFDGMQAAGLLFFWPLLLFLLLGGSYLALGFFIAVTLLLTMLIKHVAHPYLASSLVWSADTRATVALSSWLMRLSAFSPISAALADTVYYVGSTHRVYALDPMTFDQAADGGSYMDELTALKEMGYAVVKIIIGLLVAGAATTESYYVLFGVAFVVAAFASLMSVYLIRSER